MKKIIALALSVSSAFLIFTGTAFAAENVSAGTYDDAASYEETTVAGLEENADEQIFLQEITDTVTSEIKHGLYMPDVTEEMSKASYWTEKVDNPDEVLADYAQICAINDTILNGASTNMFDLKNWPYETYNGVAQNDLNISSATDNAKYAFNSGARFDKDGNKYTTWETAEEAIYKEMIQNAVDPEATEEMPVLYGICTNRTCLQILPTDHPLWDDYTDPDFGYLWQSAVRVNEPLIVKTKSADGNYYLAISSNSSGWIPAKDIAICADRDEWLAAWDLASEKSVVVYGDKIYTEESYFAPDTANRMLTMGTILPLADEAEWKDNLVINRRAYNNYVVWLPVRNADGSFKKVLGLIGENRKVQVGFLPLTISNVLDVMMNQLGDTYGWGGMLLANDCSGYVRDVYKCFGLELARNTNWQAAQPVYRVDLSAMDDEAKAECIRELPPGTGLYFSGHAMMYLGEENGKLYVISSVSDLRPDENSAVLRVRGALINTLDVRRGNQTTWLHNLHTAVVPYYTADHVITYPLKDEGVSLAATTFTYNGNALTPAVSVTYKEKALTEGIDYKLSYSNNSVVGTAKAVVTGIGKYTGTIQKTFTINPKGTTVSKLTPAKKAFTVKWKKQAKQTTGYQIRYSLKKNFKSAKTVTVKGAAKVSKKIAKLKAKKTYYVQIRTYKTAGGKNYFSAWSAAKKVKTK